MHYSLHCTAPPEIEPITLQKARYHAKVDADRTEEDWLILAAITAARQLAETQLGRRLITQTWRITIDSFIDTQAMWNSIASSSIAIEIPLSPLQSILSIKYFDSNNVEQTLDPAAYEYDPFAVRARVRPVWSTQWPQIRQRPDSIVISAIVGFGDTPEDVPASIRQWILCAVTSMYENRAIATERGELVMNSFLDGLLDPYRIVEI